MGSRRLRSRLLDLAVTAGCCACVLAPLLPVVHAAERAVVESGGHLDQSVVQSGIISHPLNGTFERRSSGVADGSVQWDLYSSANDGIKLLVSSDRDPAMRDAANGVDVDDLGADPAAWKVSNGDRRFGFSASGPLVLSRFDSGAKWRGFDGARSIEVARRGNGPVPTTRTTVKLRAEYAAPLASAARPTATINATAVVNLS